MSSPARATYIPSLDGLRSVAILLVFASHAMNAAGLARVVPGHFGVTLFFFLSGYLITTLMRQEMEDSGTVNIKLFYVRRALRIFPTFYLVLLLAALYGWAVGSMDGWYFLGQVLHLTNYEMVHAGWKAPIAPFTDVYWSLAVEEHFYLAFPMVFLLLSRQATRGRVAAGLMAACAAVLVWRCVLVFGHSVPYDRTYMATDTRIDAILFGCVLALWGNPAMDPTRIAESTWKRVLFPLSMAVLVGSLAVRNREFRETFGYTLQGLSLFAVFVTAIRYPDWAPMRLLNLRTMKWLGLLSYAIYLIHPAMLELARALVGRSLLPLTVVAAVFTVGGAAALYYGIEKPMARVRRRFHAPAQAPAAAGTATQAAPGIVG
jgi:peptidoglycan/LPS O-acetylase OafA/YrhL